MKSTRKRSFKFSKYFLIQGSIAAELQTGTAASMQPAAKPGVQPGAQGEVLGRATPKMLHRAKATVSRPAPGEVWPCHRQSCSQSLSLITFKN